MQREIFRVEAFIVDANGTFNFLPDYPKNFDSKNYNNDIDKAYRRAEGDAFTVWGNMCKVDTRQVQTVTVSNINGVVLFRKSGGNLTVPDPEPEPEPEPETEPTENE